MKLTFKQKLFAWFDSYDIYDEDGNVYFTVKGELAFGHAFKIYDRFGNLMGSLKQKIFSFLPNYMFYDENDNYIGSIRKEFSFFTPKFNMDFCGFNIEGNWLQWDYQIYKGGKVIATVNKEILRLTDTYTIEADEQYLFHALLVVIAIDAIKCSSNNNN